MLKFGLIRHAMTQWNFEKKIQGREDIDLNFQGVEQAHLFAKLLIKEKFDKIFSSTMIRARHTAEIISKIIKVDIEYSSDLREQDFGEWEGEKISDLRKSNPNQVEIQESKGWLFTPPGGESRNNVLKRNFKAIEYAAKKFDNRYILIVTHSSVIKTLIYKVLNRKFIPEESSVLKNYHLHQLSYDNNIAIEKLNSIDLRKVPVKNPGKNP